MIVSKESCFSNSDSAQYWVGYRQAGKRPCVGMDANTERIGTCLQRVFYPLADAPKRKVDFNRNGVIRENSTSRNT